MVSAQFAAFVAAAVALSGVQAKQACACPGLGDSATEYLPVTWGNLPHTWEQGQVGHNGATA